MKSVLSFFLPAVLLLSLSGNAQQTCGYDLLLQRLEPAKREALQEEYTVHVKDVLDREAANGNNAGRPAGSTPVPVVFHFLLTDAQKAQLGGDAGIQNRVIRQLEVLNTDFNGLNPDQAQIPAPFKSRFGNAGIGFGLAGATSAYTIAKGIEVRTISNSSYDYTTGYADAKRFAEGGLNGWDPSKYLNIWVFDPGGTILGLAVPVRFVGSSFGGGIVITKEDVGIALHYGVVGKRQAASELYLPKNDQGRTLTHETGHFFNLAHIWGNTDGSCSIDDGIADTPPQFKATYCDTTINGIPNSCPVFPKHDNCSPSGNGIMFMNFMDYVDDAALLMFTKNQASVMQADVSPNGPLASLTNNPSAITDAILPASRNLLDLSPNPATTYLNVQSPSGEKITAFTLSDVTGKAVFQAVELSPTQNRISLSGYARGLYFVRAVIAGQPLTGKVLLQ